MEDEDFKPNTAQRRSSVAINDDKPRTARRPGSVAFADDVAEPRAAPGTALTRPGSVAFADDAAEPRAGTAHTRPGSTIRFYDQHGGDAERQLLTPASDGNRAPSESASASRPKSTERPGSVLLIDEPPRRSSRATTATFGDAQSLTINEEDDHELAAEKEIKDRLQSELTAVSKRSAGKELVHHEPQGEQDVPAARVGTARAGTAGPKSKPGTARELKSRGRSQQRSRGVPGSIGVLWKEAYRPVVAPTTADNGYRHVLTVHTIVPGGAADATGRVKVGDKLIAVQDAGQSNRKVVVGLKKEEIRRALHGDAGIAISLELLRATDMGAKKAFMVNLVRTTKLKSEATAGTKLPQIRKPYAHGHRGEDREHHDPAQHAVPFTPSVKQTGWAKGVRLRGNLAPGDADLKEYVYHSMSEEERDQDLDQGNESAQGFDDGDEEDQLKAEQKRLQQLTKLKVSDKLTNKEKEQLEVMKKHKEKLEEESKRHSDRELYLLNAIHNCEDELMKARELFCDVARRATGIPLDPPKCTHKNHGAVHSLQTCMQEFRPIIDAFLTKIEEAPKYLPPIIAEERKKEEEESQVTKETARELRDAKATLQMAEERHDRRVAEMAAELEKLRNTYDEEKAEIQGKTDEEIVSLLQKIEMREKQIEELKAQVEELREELDSIVELKDVEEIKLRLLEAEAEHQDSDENQLKKVEVLKLACRAAGLNKDALQEALKDAAVRAQMEVLKKRETELEAEVERLRASEDKLHEDEKLHRKFKWSVMINVSDVDPDDVKKEEKRQKAGEIEDQEIVQAVQDYVEAAPDDAEIFVRNIQDYVSVRFPFLELTEHHKQLISDAFEELFKEVPPPTEEELKELERLRLEDEAIDYGYERKEATGRTAGQLRKMIADAQAATKAAKDADRKRREASWEDDGSEKEVADSEDSDAVYKSDNPEDEEGDDDDV